MSTTDPTDLEDAIAGLAPDPRPDWPPVPPTPVVPGVGWRPRTLGSTGLVVWSRPLAPDDGDVEVWAEHRERFSRTGLWPVLVDEAFWEAVELEVAAAETITDVRGWLVRELTDGEDRLTSQLARATMPPLPEPDAPLAVVGTIVPPVNEIVLVPTQAGWLVPERIGWDGSVNQDVMGAEHTGVLGRWAGLYGAELVMLGRDVVTLVVRTPPRTSEAALGAALEAVAYCHDSVFQGVETLEGLVPMVGGHGWLFWWD